MEIIWKQPQRNTRCASVEVCCTVGRQTYLTAAYHVNVPMMLSGLTRVTVRGDNEPAESQVRSETHTHTQIILIQILKYKRSTLKVAVFSVDFWMVTLHQCGCRYDPTLTFCPTAGVVYPPSSLFSCSSSRLLLTFSLFLDTWNSPSGVWNESLLNARFVLWIKTKPEDRKMWRSGFCEARFFSLFYFLGFYAASLACCLFPSRSQTQLHKVVDLPVRPPALWLFQFYLFSLKMSNCWT